MILNKLSNVRYPSVFHLEPIFACCLLYDLLHLNSRKQKSFKHKKLHWENSENSENSETLFLFSMPNLYLNVFLMKWLCLSNGWKSKCSKNASKWPNIKLAWTTISRRNWKKTLGPWINLWILQACQKKNCCLWPCDSCTVTWTWCRIENKDTSSGFYYQKYLLSCSILVYDRIFVIVKFYTRYWSAWKDF